MTELMNAPDLYTLPDDPEGLQQWRIKSDGEAAWAMRKIRDAKARSLAVERTAEAEIRRIEAWRDHERRGHEQESEFFETHVSDYALRVREASGGRHKSVSTPYGVVRTRVTQPKVEQDSETVLEWARKAHPDLVIRSEEFNLAQAKKTLTVTDEGVIDPATQEVVPGLHVTPGRLTATVTPDMSGEA